MGIAVPSFAAACHDHLVARFFQVAQQVVAIAIAHQRARRYLDDQVRTAPAEAVGSLTVLASLGLPMALMREVCEIRVAQGCTNDDAAAVAAVAAVGPAPRRVLFAPKAEAAVPSGAPLHKDGHTIHKHGWRPVMEIKSRRATCLSSLARGLGHRRRIDRNDVDPPAILVKDHLALDHGEDRPITAEANVLAWSPLGAVLAAKDAARLGHLAAKELDSQHLRIRIAAVAT
jgi:hypothetical protein